MQNLGGYYSTLGESDFEFWGTWNHGQLAALKGEFVLQDLWLSTHAPGKVQPHVPVANAAQNHSVFYDQLTGRIQWRHSVTGWHLQGDRFVVSRDGWLWPASAFNVDVQTTAQDKNRVTANASFVRLQDVLALQALLPESDDTRLQAIRRLAPSADLKNVNLVWQQDRPQDFVLHAELEKAGLNAWEKIPGARGIKAVVDAHNDQGQVQFDTGKAVLDMPALFRNEHHIEQLRGQLHWSFAGDAWTLSSDDLVLNTADVDSRMSFELELPTTERSPFLSLIAKFSNGDGSHAAQYYPAKIMHPATVDWLDHAIAAAHVTSGGVIFRGNTRDFPFRNHQGEFEVRFNLEHGVLDYAPQWPQLENINAEVVFLNEGMTITSDSANIFRSDLSHIKVNIPDLGAKPMQLSVKGDVAGETQEKLWYLQSSPPLNRRFGKYLENIHATGSSDLGLDIDFRIGKDVFNADVNGVLAFHDNAIKVDTLGTLLTHTSGQLKISPDGLRATSLSADLLGQPAQLLIGTRAVKGAPGERNIRISATGDFDAGDLTQRYAPVLHDLVQGKAGWLVNVNVPFHDLTHDLTQSGEAGGETQAAAPPSAIDVTVESDLKGIESRLPAPFNKEKQRSITLSISSMLHSDQHNVSKLVLGGLLDGIVEVNYAGAKPAYRGEIRFGGGPVALPDQPGLRLTGHLDDLNVDVWRNLIAQMGGNDKQETDTSQAGTSGCCAWLNSADLSVSSMLLYGQTLSDLQVSAENVANRLETRLASKELSGVIVVPANLQTLPIELNLDYWHLSSSSMTSEGSVDPRDIPAIKAFCKSVTFKQRNFGSVRLETTRLAQGLRLEQLVVKPRDTTITANGSWVIEAGKQKSSFGLQLDSSNLGNTMNDLNYVGSIDGGKGTLNATILWPGPLTDVDLEHLQGHVALDFKDGRLLEVDPGGAGRRLFGLFSIQTLPRRLLLDFSDLFKKGFEFNEIKGDFNITQGNAYTNNFSLDGPGVDAEMSGRIGLAAQDYDQKVLVTPHVSDVTALLSLLSSQPILFIVQQLLKDKINKVASFEYHLTGPWDNYKLAPVNEVKPKNDTDDDF